MRVIEEVAIENLRGWVDVAPSAVKKQKKRPTKDKIVNAELMTSRYVARCPRPMVTRFSEATSTVEVARSPPLAVHSNQALTSNLDDPGRAGNAPHFLLPRTLTQHAHKVASS